VTDNGVPALSSTTRIVVSVEDKNDEEPGFLERLYRVRVPRLPQSLIHLGLFRVVAFDRDLGLNAKLNFSINVISGRESGAVSGGGVAPRGGSKFSIHPSSGMIFALKELEDKELFDLQVRLCTLFN